MPSFKKLQSADPDLNRVQQNLDTFFKSQSVTELNGGVIVEGKLIGTSDTFVQHGLGREPRGYLVIDKNANANIYTSATTNSRPKLELILRASASVTVDLYIF